MAIASDRRFGVEIEFTWISLHTAAEALNARNIFCDVQDYNHRTSTTWKITTDGSVRSNNGHGGELVSPPLSGEAGLEQVKIAVAALVAAGARVNSTCGLHVHVDAGDLSPIERLNIARRYGHFESQIDNLMAPSRRGELNTYCRSLSPIRNSNIYNNRYFKINLAAYQRHRTIEFRHHHGTLNIKKISNWIKFCVNFVEAGKNCSLYTEEFPFTGAERAQRRRGRDTYVTPFYPIGTRGMQNFNKLIQYCLDIEQEDNSQLPPSRRPSALTMNTYYHHCPPRGHVLLNIQRASTTTGMSSRVLITTIKRLVNQFGFDIEARYRNREYYVYRFGNMMLPAVPYIPRPPRRRRGQVATVPVALATTGTDTEGLAITAESDRYWRGLDSDSADFYNRRMLASLARGNQRESPDAPSPDFDNEDLELNSNDRVNSLVAAGEVAAPMNRPASGITINYVDPPPPPPPPPPLAPPDNGEDGMNFGFIPPPELFRRPGRARPPVASPSVYINTTVPNMAQTNLSIRADRNLNNDISNIEASVVGVNDLPCNCFSCRTERARLARLT